MVYLPIWICGGPTTRSSLSRGRSTRIPADTPRSSRTISTSFCGPNSWAWPRTASREGSRTSARDGSLPWSGSALGESSSFYASRPAPNPLADLNLADNATILRGLGVSPEVLEDHYLSRVADDPNDVSALVNLGNLLFEQERYVEAAGYYRSALDIDPSMVSARTDLGIVLLQLGRYQEAITAFEHAVEDTPNDALPHYNLGVALAQGGETQRAIAELEAALRLVTPESSVPVGAVELMLRDLRGQLGGA